MRVRAALLLTVGLSAVTGCRCARSVDPIEEGFRAPAELDLGAVPVGEVRRRPVQLASSGLATLRVTAELAQPFDVAPRELELPGGGTRDVEISFRPSTLGSVEAELTLTAGPLSRTVRVRGEGLAPCRPLDGCHGTRFDDLAGLCRDTLLADDAPCSNACLEAGRCRAGTCVGLFASCDDSDACTVDACGTDGTCLHVPMECPVTGACRVARCEPLRGCVNDDLVADGTVCGASSCAVANVCIAGECVERAAPNAAVDCRYSAACAAESYTCASTLSGKLRCWGEGKALGRPTRVVSPFFVPGASEVKAPLCAQAGPAWLTTAGAVGPQDHFVLADAGLGPLVEVRPAPSGWLGLDVDGAVRMVTTPLPSLVTTYAERGALRLFPEGCILHGDGGVRCAGGTRVVFPGQTPHDMTFSPYNFTWAGLFAGGRVETSTGVTLEDAGATAVGSISDYRLCWGVPGEVRCVATWLPDSGVALPWPQPVSALTSGGRALCGLSDAGQLTCWGENFNGETSDRGTEPEELTRLGDGGFTAIAVGFAEVLALRGDELFATGSFGVDLDGGRRSISRQVGASSLVSLGRLPGATRVSRHCLLADGGLWCWFAGRPLRFGIGEVERLCRTAPCAIDKAGRLWCIEENGLPAVRATGLSPGDECPLGCRLHRDGGVTCSFGPRAEAQVLLPGPATQVTESSPDACAVVGGSVWCWPSFPTEPDGGIAATRVPGVRTPVRILRAAQGYRCAVSGQNGLQCWQGAGPVTDVAIKQPIVDLEVAGSGYGTNACVRYSSGEVDCFGNNQFGQLGFVPNTGQLPVPVVR